MDTRVLSLTDPLDRYQLIYQAGKNKDELFLNELKKKGYSIDSDLSDKDYKKNVWYAIGSPLCPAGKLASEGDVESANFLLAHGASAKYIAYGHAIAGNGNEIRKLEKYIDPFAYSEKLSEFAAFGGKDALKQINALFEEPCRITPILIGASKGGHWAWINSLFEHFPSPGETQSVSYGILYSVLFLKTTPEKSKEFLLRAFSLLKSSDVINNVISDYTHAFLNNNWSFEKLAENSFYFDIHALKYQADKIKAVMKERNLDYEEARSIIQVSARAEGNINSFFQNVSGSITTKSEPDFPRLQ